MAQSWKQQVNSKNLPYLVVIDRYDGDVQYIGAFASDTYAIVAAQQQAHVFRDFNYCPKRILALHGNTVLWECVLNETTSVLRG